MWFYWYFFIHLLTNASIWTYLYSPSSSRRISAPRAIKLSDSFFSTHTSSSPSSYYVFGNSNNNNKRVLVEQTAWRSFARKATTCAYDIPISCHLSLSFNMKRMGFSFFFHFSNLELKVFVEDSFNFVTDYCVTYSIRDWITVFRRRLRKTGAKFYLQKLNNKIGCFNIRKNKNK